MKKLVSLLMLLVLAFPVTGADAAKSKATPTPPPMEISADVEEPPVQITRLLDVAYQEWESAEGKAQIIKSKKNDKGKKVVINKYTQWYNPYYWNSNGWCAGFVSWCMIEAGLAELDQEATDKKGTPVYIGWETIKGRSGDIPAPVYAPADSEQKKMFSSYQHYGRITAYPQKGFVVLYGSGGNKYVHVGIVYDVEPLGGGKYRLTTIEGAMGSNTVRMYVFDYDMNAKQTKNVTAVPAAERDRDESDMFQYTLKATSKKAWYITKFLMPWIPGDEALEYAASEESPAVETPGP